MTRPQPRRSPLAGLSPITDTPTTTPATTPTPAPPASPATPAFEKITIRVPADVAGQARAAFWTTGHITGTRSLSEWITGAITNKLAADQRTYNEGREFVSVPAGTIPTGRRS